MTGYLWLCEKCEGSGWLIDMQDFTWRTIGTYMGGEVFSYETRKGRPCMCQCPYCSGRGYWEAT